MIVELVVQDCVKRIREDYERDWKSKEMRLRQRFVNSTILLVLTQPTPECAFYSNINLLYHSAL